MLLSRRGLLNGRFRAGGNELRPPWALAPGAFEDRCNRCGACLKACPDAIVVRGAGGFPTVDFSNGECSFCGDCAQVCKVGALRVDSMSPWELEATIGEGCLAAHGIECRVCGEACGAMAIRFRPRLGGVAHPQLDAELCSGCGACYGPCPVNAIAMTDGRETRG